MVFFDILFRWIHVSTACVLFGSAFFMTVILPVGLFAIAPEPREAAFLRTRRAFKLVVHPGILLLLISGTYNAIRNWRNYTLQPPLLHGLFGVHLFLGIAIFVILLILLAGREPRPSSRTWMRVNLVLLFLTVAVASTLKWGRERAVVRHTAAQARMSLEQPGH